MTIEGANMPGLGHYIYGVQDFIVLKGLQREQCVDECAGE